MVMRGLSHQVGRFAEYFAKMEFAFEVVVLPLCLDTPNQPVGHDRFPGVDG
jgi:hypothetical protein